MALIARLFLHVAVLGLLRAESSVRFFRTSGDIVFREIEGVEYIACSANINDFVGHSVQILNSTDDIFGILKKCRRQLSGSTLSPVDLNLICLVEVRGSGKHGQLKRLFNLRVNFNFQRSSCSKAKVKIDVSPASRYLIYEWIFRGLGYDVSFVSRELPSGISEWIADASKVMPVNLRVNDKLIELPDDSLELLELVLQDVGLFFGHSPGSDCSSFILVDLKTGAFRFLSTSRVFVSEENRFVLEAPIEHFRAYPCEIPRRVAIYRVHGGVIERLVGTKAYDTDDALSKYLLGYKIFHLGLPKPDPRFLQALECKPYRVTWKTESMTMWCRIKMPKNMFVSGKGMTTDFRIDFTKLLTNPRILVRYARSKGKGRRTDVFKINRNIPTKTFSFEKDSL